MPDLPVEDDPAQSAESTGDRWALYKYHERQAGREPMAWGDWLRAGQPVPAE